MIYDGSPIVTGPLPSTFLFVSNNSSGSWNTSIFVQPNDNLAEIWEGRRIGVDNAMKNWPVENAYSIENSIEKIKPKNSYLITIIYIYGDLS